MKNEVKNLMESFLKNNAYNIPIKFINKRECVDKYNYAHRVDKLRRSLIGEKDCSHVNNYLLKTDIAFLNSYKKFEKILTNKYFNPYKYYELSEYYIKSDTFSDLDKIFTFKNNPELKQNIALKGEKGSGKTALINCWLNENHDILEGNKIFWVRCDGHKLYRLWLQYFNKFRKGTSGDYSGAVTIDEYLSIQFVYVFCKYCMSDDRDFINKILNEIKDNNVTYNYPSSRRSTLKTEKRKLYDEIVNTRNSIIKTEKEKGDYYSYAFDHIMVVATTSSHKWEKRKWIALSDALQLFFRNNGYWILKIVDGVDNIHINEISSKPYYESMLDLSFNFLRRSPQKNQLHFMAMRERTLYECLTRPPMPDTMGYSDVYEIKHKVSCFKKILKARNNFAKTKFGDTGLFSEICKNVCKNIPDNVNLFHHNNVRTFLYNKLSLISQVYYRIKQLGGATPNIKHHVKYLQKRNKFLNGRLFLSTIDEWYKMNSEIGLYCINLFYFNIETYSCLCSYEWQGLCKTRILQLLSIYQKLTSEQLILFLNKALEYDLKLIEQNISDLKAYGMIDTKFDGYIYLTISEKGNSYLEKSYTDLDTLYYFAIDTPLPSYFFENNLINCHNNKFRNRTNYPYSVISTTLSFLSYLIYINDIENDKFCCNFDKINNMFKCPLMKLTLPFFEKEPLENILANYYRLIDSRKDAEDQVELAYISDFLGVIKYH